jgi:glycosyltransferase involved in cell wall biosynthesis
MLEARGRWKALDHRDSVVAHCPLTPSGDYQLSLVRRLNARRAVREVRRMELVPERTVAFVNTPFLPEILEGAPWGAVVYDWHDDFAAFDWAPAGAQALEARTMAQVDVATSGTRFLATTKGSDERPVHFLQNGVRFSAYADSTDPPPNDLPSGFAHIAGFIGTLSQQLDINLIERAATSLPDVAFVFIGPNRLERPLRGDNVFTLGLRPFERLPAYVRAFDVGLIPYAIKPGVEAINPTKLLEYAAAGVPVVSTPLPDVEMLFGSIAKIAGDAESFAEQIRAACRGDLDAVAHRARERARATTWEALGDALWEIILQAWRENRT